MFLKSVWSYPMPIPPLYNRSWYKWQDSIILYGRLIFLLHFHILSIIDGHLGCPYILTIVVIILQCTWGCTSLFSPLIKLVLIVDTKICMFDTKTCWEPPQEIPPMTKVMRRRSDRRRWIRTRGIPWTCSSIYRKTKICLLFTILCLSPTLLTLTGGYPWRKSTFLLISLKKST